LSEVPHIAFARVAQCAVRQSLSAPIERGYCETSCAQIAHGLEIFLDEFRPTLKQADGPFASPRRSPPRKTQRDPVRRVESSGDDVLGPRVGGGAKGGAGMGGAGGGP